MKVSTDSKRKRHISAHLAQKQQKGNEKVNKQMKKKLMESAEHAGFKQ